MTAKKSPPARAGDSVPPATSEDDDRIPWWVRDTEQQLRSIKDGILISAEPGYMPIDSAPAANSEPSTELSTSTSTTTSRPSGKRRGGSKKQWHKPTNAKELAAQINQVATMVLNGEIDLEVVKPYSTLIRGEVQVLSVQVTQARFARTVPELDLDLEVFDGDEEEPAS